MPRDKLYVTMAKTPRPRVGDIIEIPIPDGFGYALYSHEHATPPKMGSLLRVLPVRYKERPVDVLTIPLEREQFSVFFPLSAAIRMKLVRVAGNAQLPEWAVRFPVFRNGLPDRDGVVHEWWLWDGNREWKAGVLTPELRRLPRLGTVNDTRLIEMIQMGYRPEDS